MPDDKKLVTNLNNLWQRLDKTGRDIVLCLAYTDYPVSIDTIIAISKTSIVTTLNVMENLRREGIIYEKRDNEKGVYFLRNNLLPDFVQGQVNNDELKKVASKIIEYYSQAPTMDEKKILILADLYVTLDIHEKGYQYIMDAADILHNSGNNEKALLYYDHIIQDFKKERPLQIKLKDFFLCVIKKTIISMWIHLPAQQQMPLLLEAQALAEQHNQSDCLAIIKAILSLLLQKIGNYKMASQHLNHYLKLKKYINDPILLKLAMFPITEYYIWQGMFSEATRHYEETVEDVEAFENNERTLILSSMVGMCHFTCGRTSRGIGMIRAIRSKADSLNLQKVVTFCDMQRAYCCLELRKLPEAETYLNRLSSFPDETLGKLTSWPLCECKSYACCLNKDYETALRYAIKGLNYSRSLGVAIRIHLPIVFETILILESKGIVDPKINLDSEINCILSQDNFFNKGIALRYRALRNMGKQQSEKKILPDLLNSEKQLNVSGAEIELARTRIALRNYFLKKRETKTSASYFAKVSEFVSKIDRRLLPTDLSSVMPHEQKVELMAERITKANESLGTIKNSSVFLERVINVAMDFTSAMRGAFFILDSGKPKIIASRNLDPSTLNTHKAKKFENILADAARKGATLIIPPPQKETPLSGSFFSEINTIPRICMPARIGDEIQGYLCLDSPFDGKPFSANLHPFVKMLCSQIAVGLTNIKAYNDIKQQRDRFEDEAIFYRKKMGVAGPTSGIIGGSQGIKHVIQQIQHVALTDTTVLILGETGVGKELVAKAIHNLSTRKNGSFIPVNLATLPHELVAGELFGHEKGSFTGAHERQKGRFELADAGTIFLDEIGDLPPAIQVKLLRVLQESTFERLGSSKPIQSDFRVITATHKDLRMEVEKKTFRKDLYYRLNVFPIKIPPLRERKNDIPELSRYFIEKFSKRLGKSIPRIPAEEMKRLTDYPWPGNVRELEHFIERAVILSDEQRIIFSGLEDSLPQSISKNGQSFTPMADMEREHITKALNTTGWKVSGLNGAASLLKLKRSTLRSRMKKLGIQRPFETHKQAD